MQQISHYCRSLYKNKFVDIRQQGNMKYVFARIFLKAKPRVTSQDHKGKSQIQTTINQGSTITQRPVPQPLTNASQLTTQQHPQQLALGIDDPTPAQEIFLNPRTGNDAEQDLYDPQQQPPSQISHFVKAEEMGGGAEGEPFLQPKSDPEPTLQDNTEFTPQNLPNDYWQHLRDSARVYKELTLKENIIIFLSSNEVVSAEGICNNDLALKINKFAERKMLQRALSKIRSEGYHLVLTPDRTGKVFSLKLSILAKKQQKFAHKEGARNQKLESDTSAGIESQQSKQQGKSENQAPVSQSLQAAQKMAPLQ